VEIMRHAPGGHGEVIDGVENAIPKLKEAIDDAKAALVGDSNDAEHDALVSLIEALGEGEVPECTCDDRSWHGEHHDSACPASAWEGGAA